MVSPREAKESAHTLNNARKTANGRHRKGGPLDENTAAQSLQDLVRGRIISDYRLHRSNLAERLKFESSVVWESLRFLNQLLVFALFLGALRLSSNEVQKRGIFENLKEVFDFETLIAIKTRQQFVDEALYPISEASREYFLLSTRYFGDNGAGSRQIIRDVASFDAPLSVGQLPLGTSQFSFTAWVQTSPGFVEGYIVQKPLGVTGLSCWGWHLHSSLGPSLHYGGHDSYPQDPSFPPQAMAERQIRVSPAQSPSFSTGNFAMLTLAVSASKVEFFHNAELLSTVPLTTRITDCLSERGVLAGAAQMKVMMRSNVGAQGGIEEGLKTDCGEFEKVLRRG